MLSPSKAVHFIAALLTTIAWLIVTARWADLTKDPQSTFDTVGVFLTIYGILFTIIELFRARSAVALAALETGKLSQRIEKFYGIRDLIECQSLIVSALERADEDGTVSSSSLGRIVRLYAAEFPVETQNENSQHRVRVSIVGSFSIAARQSKHTKLLAADKLKTTLMEMMVDLAALDSSRVHTEQLQ